MPVNSVVKSTGMTLREAPEEHKEPSVTRGRCVGLHPWIWTAVCRERCHLWQGHFPDTEQDTQVLTWQLQPVTARGNKGGRCWEMSEGGEHTQPQCSAGTEHFSAAQPLQQPNICITVAAGICNYVGIMTFIIINICNYK